MYKNFIGIDIGKFKFVANKHGSKSVNEYRNNHSGIREFLSEYKIELKNGLSVLETTGGYEMRLLHTLCQKKIAVHRADASNVKNFIRSFGKKAKTDKLDSIALSLYGFERAEKLGLYKMPSQSQLTLFELVQRRRDLIAMRSAEKCRLQGPKVEVIYESCNHIIDILSKEIERLNSTIDSLIAEIPDLAAKKQVVQTVPGIGALTANDMVVLLPELGRLTSKQIASLAGVAPRANESGQYKGHSSTGHGREGIKSMLFISAMAAARSKSSLRSFYNQLVGRGKKKKIALVAVMRKIIVIANARVRDMYKEQEKKQTGDVK